MKIRALVLAGSLASISASAHAVFFFFLPIGAIQNAVQGGHCVPETAKAGDRINLGGKSWVIKETNGVSSRCSQYPQWPVIAKLEPYISETEAAEEMQACLPAGTTPGARTNVPGVGEVYVRSLISSGVDCTDMRTPVSARVVRAGNVSQPPIAQPQRTDPVKVACVPAGVGPGDRTSAGDRQVEIVRVLRRGPPCDSRPEAPMIAEYREIPVTPSLSPAPPGKSISERLRELKQLREENLITQEVYEGKQREILAGQ